MLFAIAHNWQRQTANRLFLLIFNDIMCVCAFLISPSPAHALTLSPCLCVCAIWYICEMWSSIKNNERYFGQLFFYYLFILVSVLVCQSIMDCSRCCRTKTGHLVLSQRDERRRRVIVCRRTEPKIACTGMKETWHICTVALTTSRKQQQNRCVGNDGGGDGDDGVAWQKFCEQCTAFN